MTEQTLKEIFKSFAYGMDVEDVAEDYGLSIADARKIKAEHAAEIAAKAAKLKEMGMI